MLSWLWWQIVVVSAAVGAPGVQSFEVDQTPREKWEQAEARMLSNVRQLTSPSMGLDKSGEAYFSPDGRTIIFQAYPHGEQQYQMYTLGLEANGKAIPSSLHRISPVGGACTCGYFRPDGKRLMFASTYLNPNAPSDTVYHRQRSSYHWEMPAGMDIFETNLDGSQPRQLTRTNGYDAEGSYSNDGTKIVFTSCRDGGDAEIYVMNADGTNPRRITHAPGYDGGPFFSPDARRIIFRADRKKNDNLQLFVVNSDGSGERQLTENEFVNWGPYWHPNGHTIAFATSAHGHENYEVYLMNVDTGRTARVTYRMGFDGLPVFSRDGKRMMWTGKRGPDGTSQIFEADFMLPAGF